MEYRINLGPFQGKDDATDFEVTVIYQWDGHLDPALSAACCLAAMAAKRHATVEVYSRPQLPAVRR